MMIPQLAMNGLIAGAVYALTAVGLAMIYGTTRIFHAAHASSYMIGAYSLFLLVVGLRLPIEAAFALTIIITFLAGIIMELLVYRPLRRRDAGLGGLFIASLGMLIFVQGLLALVFGADIQVLRTGPLPTYELLSLRVTSLHVLVILVTVTTFSVLQLFLTRTRLGKEVRAYANDPELAVSVGIDTDRLNVVVMGIGSSLAGIAASLISLDIGVRPGLGFSILIVSFISVFMGGVGSLPGAGMSAVLLGLIQNLAVWKISFAWQDAIGVAVLLLFLIFRPHGLLGHK